jgi:hypothetical protein
VVYEGLEKFNTRKLDFQHFHSSSRNRFSVPTFVSFLPEITTPFETVNG